MSLELQSLINAFLAERSEARQHGLLCSLLHQPDSQVLPYIRRFAGSADTQQRLLAAGLMGEIGYPRQPYLKERLRLLKQLALHDASAKVRARAVLSLAYTHAPDALPVVVQLKCDRTIVVRKTVAEACASFDDPVAFETLKVLIDDDSPAVREYAVIGMGFMHSCRCNAIGVLRKTSPSWPDTTIHEAIDSRIRLGDEEVIGEFAALCEAHGLPSILVEAVWHLPWLHENAERE